MEDKHKLRVKIGQSEFEAEGSAERVEEEFHVFLKAVATIGAEAEVIKGAGTLGGSSGESNILSRAFLEEEGVLSLQVLPNSKHRNADALLHILYGYFAIKGEGPVLSLTLLKAAKQSGIPLDRVDKTLKYHRLRFTKAGQRKGAKYGLNNAGRAKAKDILEALQVIIDPDFNQDIVSLGFVKNIKI